MNIKTLVKEFEIMAEEALDNVQNDNELRCVQLLIVGALSLLFRSGAIGIAKYEDYYKKYCIPDVIKF